MVQQYQVQEWQEMLVVPQIFQIYHQLVEVAVRLKGPQGLRLLEVQVAVLLIMKRQLLAIHLL